MTNLATQTEEFETDDSIEALKQEIEAERKEQEETPAQAEPTVEVKEVERRAREHGWKAKEEFDRLPQNWVPPDRYLELPRTQVKILEKRIEERDAKHGAALEEVRKSATRTAAALAKKAYDERLAEIRARQDEAVEGADVEAHRKAREEEAKLGPAPEVPEESPDSAAVEALVKAELAKYPSWGGDQMMVGKALEVLNAAPHMAGASMSERIAYADQYFQRFHSDLLKPAAPPPIRAAQPSTVDSGGLGSFDPPAKTFHDLSPEDQAVGKMFVDEGLYKDTAAYAAAYFSEFKE